MRRVAKIIITRACSRIRNDRCNLDLSGHKMIYKDEELLRYEEIVLAGGEPMIVPKEILEFQNRIKAKGYKGKIHIQTSLWLNNGISKEVLKALDGIIFLLHAGCTEKEIMALKSLSNSGILQNKDFYSCLVIDKQVYEKYDLSNINLTRWSVIRKLYIKKENIPEQKEDLLIYELEEETQWK